MTEIVKKLDAKARQGALLDAAGQSKQQIQSLLGVSESTVSRWRRSDLYKAERAKLEERHFDAIAPLLTRIKTKVVEGAENAIGALVLALEATDDEGNPHWSTRIEAARTLKAWKEKETEVRAEAEPGAGGAVNIVVAVGDVERSGVKVAARPQHVENLEGGDGDGGD